MMRWERTAWTPSGDLGVATDVAAEPDESDGAGRAVRVWTWNASERPASLQRRRRHLADPPLPSVAATRESAMASEPQLAVGEHLGAYRIEMLVARGGMGEVYRALDRRLGRPVALKVLVREIADQPLFRERFLRESRLAASLDHPNVLPIYEAGEFGDRLFIAMRFVEGTDLRQVLRQSAPLDPERALALIAPVAGALDAA